MAHYYKDNDDAWWYLWGNNQLHRTRAYFKQCEQCGNDFLYHSRQANKNRFCSKECSGKWQYKHNIQNVTASAEDSPNWKGGTRKRRRDVLMVYMPDHPHASEGYVWVHRLVMEQVIGRYLEPHELIHHIDGDPLNNHPDNLQIVTASEHAKIHDSQRERDEYGRYLPLQD